MTGWLVATIAVRRNALSEETDVGAKTAVKGLNNVRRQLGLTRPNAATARLVVERNVLARRPRGHKPGGRILCYHSFGEPFMGLNNVSPDRFVEQIELALATGHRFVPASHIAMGEGDDMDLAITFDDGLRSVATVAVPILERFSIPSTLFVVAEFPYRTEPHHEPYLSWDELRHLAGRGVEMGSHSLDHLDFAKASAPVARDQLVKSKQILEQELGVPVESFAIPFGQSKNWSAELSSMAAAAGYRLIYAQAELTRSPGTCGRTFVTRYDNKRIFTAALDGAFDSWEEWF